MDKLAAAKAMRSLPPVEREEAIEGSDNVLDLRPRLEFRRKQNEMAKRYKHAWSWTRGRAL